MIDKFIEILMKEINKYYTAYYEEAPSNTKFPYITVPTINLTPLDSGYLSVFDLEIYVNELCNTSLEEILDTLLDNLDGYSYRDSTIGFHIGFDNQLLVKSNEQDLAMRRITFQARIFR